MNISDIQRKDTDEYLFTLNNKLFTYRSYQWAKMTECYSSNEQGDWASPWDEYQVGSYMPLDRNNPEQGIELFFRRFGNSTMPPEEDPI